MSGTTYRQRNKEVLNNRAKKYYHDNKEVLREKARNRSREEKARNRYRELKNKIKKENMEEIDIIESWKKLNRKMNLDHYVL